MTHEQLELMVSRTGQDRLRWTTSDDNPDAGQREWVRKWVRDMAAHDTWPPRKDCGEKAARAEGPKPLPLADALHARKYGFSNCWFSYKDSDCGCSGLQCHLLERRVTLRDCAACLAK